MRALCVLVALQLRVDCDPQETETCFKAALGLLPPPETGANTTLSGRHMAGTSCAHCGIPPAHKLQLQALKREREKERGNNNCIVCLCRTRRVFLCFLPLPCCVSCFVFFLFLLPHCLQCVMEFSPYRGEFLTQNILALIARLYQR